MAAWSRAYLVHGGDLPPRTLRQAVAPRRQVLGVCLGGAGAMALAGCRTAPAPHYRPPANPAAIVYAVARGWHTGLALPAQTPDRAWRPLPGVFPGAGWLLFGWGERTYYMAADPGSGDALGALFPGPAVLLVTPLRRPPRDVPGTETVFALGLTPAGLHRLRRFVLAAFARSATGEPQRLGRGPGAGSVFFAAAGSYSASYTCNTWVADALQHGGLPVSPDGVVFASQVVDQVRRLALRPTG